MKRYDNVFKPVYKRLCQGFKTINFRPRSDSTVKNRAAIPLTLQND